MDDKDLISVIIPTYNSSRYIEEALESILNQTYRKTEIIVVDDGSIDNTKDILKRYIDQGKILYIKKENGGPASARNTGIKIATGNYIALLDADDVWKSDKLEKQMILLKFNDFDLTYTKRFIIGGETETEKCDDNEKTGIIDLIRSNYIINSSVVAKTDVFRGGYFDEDKKLFAVEDYDLWLRQAFRGCSFGHLPEKLTGYRIHSNQISSEKNIDNLIYLYKKNIKNTNNVIYKVLLVLRSIKMNLYKIKLKIKKIWK